MPAGQTLNTESATILYQSHKPCSIGLKVVSDVLEFANLPYEQHFGAYSTNWLLKRLLDIEQKYLAYDIFSLTLVELFLSMHYPCDVFLYYGYIIFI